MTTELLPTVARSKTVSRAGKPSSERTSGARAERAAILSHIRRAMKSYDAASTRTDWSTGKVKVVEVMLGGFNALQELEGWILKLDGGGRAGRTGKKVGGVGRK